ncbi:MAG: hypothetical protein HKN47_22190 [Pirellulaceae bacterium]|nr:hypothetical protein [Pirellulaceae bacterium]
MIHSADVLRKIKLESKAVQQSIDQARELDRTHPLRIGDLVQRQTDSFVDLAQHYLPNLSHQSMQDAWCEVRAEIGDVLLRKHDHRRQLHAELESTRKQRENLQSNLAIVREQLEHSKLVLGCKVGNVNKLLRDDPVVRNCHQEIAKLDKELDQCLAHLEAANQDANTKLPDYEESFLFQYLREQRFGTSAYQGSGIERRWDRWIAKLVDYKKHKASFDYLCNTPIELKRIVEQKQKRYGELLTHLKDAKQRASRQHGVKKQTKTWDELREKVETIEQAIEDNLWEQCTLEDQIHQLDQINGDYYDQAIAIYQQFLDKQDPDVLRVYAECTKSPRDDEICARLRNISLDIDREREQAKDRFLQIVGLEKYRSVLGEISQRLQVHVLQTVAETILRPDFDLDSLLLDIRRRQLTPDNAWRLLRESMVSPWTAFRENVPANRTRIERPVNRVPTDVEDDWRYSSANGLRPLEASFQAASNFSPVMPAGPRVDTTGVVLLPRLEQDASNQPASFTTLAVCQSKAEAKQVVALLGPSSIVSFVHTHPTKLSAQTDTILPAEFDVVVQTSRYNEAHKLLVHHRIALEREWTCGTCQSEIAQGHGRCWRCGSHRPTSPPKSTSSYRPSSSRHSNRARTN